MNAVCRFEQPRPQHGRNPNLRIGNVPRGIVDPHHSSLRVSPRSPRLIHLRLVATKGNETGEGSERGNLKGTGVNSRSIYPIYQKYLRPLCCNPEFCAAYFVPNNVFLVPFVARRHLCCHQVIVSPQVVVFYRISVLRCGAPSPDCRTVQ